MGDFLERKEFLFVGILIFEIILLLAVYGGDDLVAGDGIGAREAEFAAFSCNDQLAGLDKEGVIIENHASFFAEDLYRDDIIEGNLKEVVLDLIVVNERDLAADDIESVAEDSHFRS